MLMLPRRAVFMLLCVGIHRPKGRCPADQERPSAALEGAGLPLVPEYNVQCLLPNGGRTQPQRLPVRTAGTAHTHSLHCL